MFPVSKNILHLYASMQVQRLLAIQEGITVLFIHHTGKDSSKKARGSSVIITNSDVAIEVTAQPMKMECTLTCEKMKDAAPFEPIEVMLKVASFGTEGENSLVIDAAPLPTPIITQEKSTVASLDDTLMDILGDQSLKFSEWEKQAGLRGIPEGTFKIKPGELIKQGLVMKNPEGLYRSRKSFEIEMAMFGG